MKYAGIIKNDVVNGIGVCVSFWCQGCHFMCDGCHNPETWNFNHGIEINKNDLFNIILEAINVNGITRNLSILGGEPLCEENKKIVAELIHKTLSTYNVKIFLWTGYTFEELKQMNDPDIMFILKNVDIIVDGKYMSKLRDITLPFRGSSNQRIIDVKKTLKTGKIVLYEVD